MLGEVPDDPEVLRASVDAAVLAGEDERAACYGRALATLGGVPAPAPAVPAPALEPEVAEPIALTLVDGHRRGDDEDDDDLVERPGVTLADVGGVSARFIAVGINDVLDMYIGQSEQNLHTIFATARGRVSLAERCYRAALEIEPESASVRTRLAAVLERLGPVEEAADLILHGPPREESADPEESRTWRTELAEGAAERRRRVEERHEQRLAEIRRRDAERHARWAADPHEMRRVARRFLHDLGVVLLRRRRRAEGLRCLAQALTLDPTNAYLRASVQAAHGSGSWRRQPAWRRVLIVLLLVAGAWLPLVLGTLVRTGRQAWVRRQLRDHLPPAAMHELRAGSGRRLLVSLVLAVAAVAAVLLPGTVAGVVRGEAGSIPLLPAEMAAIAAGLVSRRRWLGAGLAALRRRRG